MILYLLGWYLCYRQLQGAEYLELMKISQLITRLYECSDDPFKALSSDDLSLLYDVYETYRRHSDVSPSFK